jgi:adenylate kinase family enzyme
MLNKQMMNLKEINFIDQFVNKSIEKNDLINLDNLNYYYKQLIKNKIYVAPIYNMIESDNLIVIKQKKIEGGNLEDIILQDALKHHNLSHKVLVLFREFLNYYNKYLKNLEDIRVDCKLSNFFYRNHKFILVDITPPLIKNFIRNPIIEINEIQITSIFIYFIKYALIMLDADNKKEIQKFNLFIYKMNLILKGFISNILINDYVSKYCTRYIDILDYLNDKTNFVQFRKDFLAHNYNYIITGNLNSMIKKVHLIGGPGVGKTYLSTRIKQFYNDFLNLDYIFWADSNQNFTIRRNQEERDNLLKNFIDKNTSYIIEGCYLDWIDYSMKHSDIIIIIRSNLKEQKKRIIKRFFYRKFHKTDFIGKETLKSLKNMIKWMFTYDKILNDFIVKNDNKNIFTVDRIEEAIKIIF